MASSVAGELPTEWWDSLADGEPVLGGSPLRPIAQGWSWADHQMDDFLLGALEFSSGELEVDARGAGLPDMVAGKLEDLFLVSSHEVTPATSPTKSAFKQSFGNRSPSGLAKVPSTPDALPTTPGHSNGSSSQTQAASGIVVDLHVASDNQSNSVTCTITSGGNDSRRCQADSGEAMDMGDGSAKNLAPEIENSTAENLATTSEHEEHSSSPGLPTDVDLQCNGEQLGAEGEEDSSRDAAAAANWLHPAAEGCMGFIPVSNSLLPSGLAPFVTGPLLSSEIGPLVKEESAETESGSSSNNEECKPAHLLGGVLPKDGAEDSPAASTHDSMVSEGTVHASGLERKWRPGQPGKLVEAPSVNDMPAAAAAGVVNGRRRPGRPSKLSNGVDSARTHTTKRKRATCKPATPAVSGQACTQCFTHVTPVWRAGPEGPKTLCNACGVRYMKVAKRK